MLYASEIVHETINTLRFFLWYTFWISYPVYLLYQPGSWHDAACQTNAELIVNAFSAENDFHSFLVSLSDSEDNLSFDPDELKQQPKV